LPDGVALLEVLGDVLVDLIPNLQFVTRPGHQAKMIKLLALAGLDNVGYEVIDSRVHIGSGASEVKNRG
jgi:hypothetical protein